MTAGGRNLEGSLRVRLPADLIEVGQELVIADPSEVPDLTSAESVTPLVQPVAVTAPEGGVFLEQALLQVVAEMPALVVLETLGLVNADSAFPPYRNGQLIWAENLLGGIIFGIGMTLASGCGNKALIRVGGGNIKSIMVVLIIAVIAYYMINPFPGSGFSTSPPERVAAFRERLQRAGLVATTRGAGFFIEHFAKLVGEKDNDPLHKREAALSEADWDAVVNVHLKGTFAPTHHAATYWRARAKAGETNDARVITTSSPSGIYGNVGQTNYGAAKMGAYGMMNVLKLDMAKYNVLVNTIAGSLTKSFTSSDADGLWSIGGDSTQIVATAVNLKGTFYGCKHAIPHMLEAGGGS